MHASSAFWPYDMPSSIYTHSELEIQISVQRLVIRKSNASTRAVQVQPTSWLRLHVCVLVQ